MAARDTADQVAAGQRGLLPGGQHQDRCEPGRQH
jgi:hypothetical protein